MSTRTRNLFISIVMILAGISIMLFPPSKPLQNAKIDLAGVIPESFYGWNSSTYDTKDYEDQWQSINQLLVRKYTKNDHSLNVYLEYSSDVRRAFSFHFPEDCYRAGGNEVLFLAPLNVVLPDGKVTKAKCIFIKGMKGKREEYDTFVAYWLVFDGKKIQDTLGVKIDQMLSGLMSKAREGYLIRIDVRSGPGEKGHSEQIAKDILLGFINDLYSHLSDKQRFLLFGKI